MSKPCPICDGDGHCERFDDDLSDVITWLCKNCSGTGEVS